jgi:hypothetical protein
MGPAAGRTCTIITGTIGAAPGAPEVFQGARSIRLRLSRCAGGPLESWLHLRWQEGQRW